VKFTKLIDSLCLRFQQQRIEGAIDLNDSFTREDLPLREPDTGVFTAAGWIPLIQTYIMRAFALSLTCISVQSTIRIVRNHETVYIVWYPFDWTISPFYKLVNISQVRISFHKKNLIESDVISILIYNFI
jgi:hypothetical protein